MSAPSSHYVGLRLRALIWSCLDCDLVRSAVFFAERYYCLDTQNHQARHLYANALLRSGHTHSALNLVNDSSCLGCTEVYSRCCNALGRYRAGQLALEKCLAQGDAAVAIDASTFQETRQFPDAAVLACRSGYMALKGNLPKDAIASFNRALAINPFMWEAVEGLCQLGSFPELNELIPPRGQYTKDGLGPKKPSASSPTHTTLFTPDTFSNGHVHNRQQNANLVGGGKGLLFKLNGGLGGGRDSIASTVDSSFGEIHSPGLYPRTYTADMMLTTSSRPTDDGRPAQKRARPEVMVNPNSEAGNKASSSRAASSIAQKRGPQRAGPDSSREPARRSTRHLVAKNVAPTKARDRRRGPLLGLSSPAPGPGSDGDEEMMSVDARRLGSPGNPDVDPLSWDDVNNQQMAERAAVEEADAYILELVRIFAKAVQCLAQYQCQDAIDELERLPIEQQHSPWVLTLTGRACYEKLDYVKAERCFQQARGLDPYRMQDMEIYSTLLWHLQRETILSFLAQELLAMDNTAPVAWIAAGNCFSLEKEHQQALTCFRRATQLDPRCVYAYNLSGHECIATDEHDKAIDFFRQALKVDPRHYPAWYGLGMVYYRTNMIDLAQWHFRKAIDTNPSNAVLICCEGMVYEQKKEYRNALEVYTRAVAAAPNSSLVMFRRARMLVELEYFTEALVILLRLRDIIPEEANIPFMLGQVYKKLGQTTQSAQYMSIALDVEPKIASAIRLAQRGGPVILDGLAPLPSGDQSMSMDTDGG